ncbi:SRPBCC domain-containing protein [Streptomyces althioticus]|uniref:SRPBCC domain-containing protein n=1 Tax=Streptomyces althioticus TaxID=83380 RepID=UPI0037A06D95
MEHEVFVPVEAQRLREVLDDPARVARAVPGLQHDAGAEPVTGRLKVRIGGSSITYRGSVRVSVRGDGVYAVEGEASESRGDGTVRLSLRLTPRPADTGTTLVVTGTATADGRVTDLPQDAVTSAVTRLLTRFAENLATATKEAAGPPESPEQLAAGDFEPGATTDFETTPDAEDPPPPPPQQPSDATPDKPSGPPTPPGPGTAPASEGASGPRAESAPDAPSGPEGDGSPGTGPAPGATSASEEDPQGESAPDAVPGPGVEPGPAAASPPDAGSTAEPETPDTGAVPATPEPLDAEFTGGIDGRPLPGDDDDDSLAEAAHARRTMIGRSAEEVDHAPPRGRYAPVPAPQTVSSSAPLRWAAPAAALAVASAVVAIRALRRRR